MVAKKGDQSIKVKLKLGNRYFAQRGGLARVLIEGERVDCNCEYSLCRMHEEVVNIQNYGDDWSAAKARTNN